MISMHLLIPILAMLAILGGGWLFLRWYLR
ncbi:Uncharacterised protein [Staphylococcus microti]|uniref:Uncharacterized protein n=1 Tax=Staphylococcus microti TaxID=569857 RepID=A0A380GS19_9STAP|nr:Uncharacterised protein [Staphylococcus microti]